MSPLFKKCINQIIAFTFLLIAFNLSAYSQTLNGKVISAANGEPLTGASIILIKDFQKYTRATGFDGSYSFKNLPTGKYDITVKYIGYDVYTSNLEFENIKSTEMPLIKLQLSKSSLSEVTVNGHKNRESDEYARKLELTVGNIMNIVSAKTIEISPDITVGNVLQRVSGVSMVRSGSGDGQYAIIRGLSNRYTYTSINGIILPSPDAGTRSVPLDMFPANMIERIEIIKALTPNVEGNAIGGATNLIMKDAPSKLTINGNLATGFNTIFFDRPFSGFSNKSINFSSPSEIYGNSYKANVSDLSVAHLNFHDVQLPLNLVTGISIGNKILNNKISYLIGGSYIREYRGSNSNLYTGQSIITNPYSATASDPVPNKSEYTALQERQYSYLQSRLGLQGKLDYIISENHSLKLYGLFLQLDDNQHRAMVQHGLSNGGEIDYFDRVVFTRKNMSNISLTGNHKLSNSFSADWTASYSVASSNRPDWADYGRFKQNASTDTVYVSNPLTHQWMHSKDADKSGYLNFKYVPSKNIEFAVGGMYRSKDRSSFYNKYAENTVVPGLGVQQFNSINSVIFSFSPAQNAYADSTNASNYTATETVSAAYIQTKITLKDKFEILGGVREETTNQSYASMISPALPAKTGSYNYVDVLPSVHFKYKLTDKQNLRLSYFSGISRPNIYELVPITISGDLYTEGGNDSLKHTTSQNIDFRYENFFSSTNYIIAGAFYKRLVNPIEVAFSPVSSSTVILQPTNPTVPAIDYGFELIFSKFINKWGVSGNYTYIHSAITTLKLIQQNDAAGNTVGILTNQTRPMQGQSNHMGNLSLLFKDAKSGFDAQLSFVYTGKRISVVSTYYGLDQWQRANSQLDFSINKSFNDHHLVVFIKATNLLNNSIYQDILTPNIKYQSGYPGNADPNKILVQKDDFKQTILAGIRFKL